MIETSTFAFIFIGTLSAVGIVGLIIQDKVRKHRRISSCNTIIKDLQENLSDELELMKDPANFKTIDDYNKSLDHIKYLKATIDEFRSDISRLK